MTVLEKNFDFENVEMSNTLYLFYLNAIKDEEVNAKARLQNSRLLIEECAIYWACYQSQHATQYAPFLQTLVKSSLRKGFSIEEIDLEIQRDFRL
jgi:dipeptide/tripeptide permease